MGLVPKSDSPTYTQQNKIWQESITSGWSLIRRLSYLPVSLSRSLCLFFSPCLLPSLPPSFPLSLCLLLFLLPSLVSFSLMLSPHPCLSRLCHVMCLCACFCVHPYVFVCVETPPSRTKPYSWGDFCSTMRLEENYCFVRKKTDWVSSAHKALMTLCISKGRECCAMVIPMLHPQT